MSTLLKIKKIELSINSLFLTAYINEISVSGRIPFASLTELIETFAACNQESFCFSFCCQTPILAFRSFSFISSNSIHAITTIFFVSSSKISLNRIKKFFSLVENRAAFVAPAMVSLTLMAILRMSSSPPAFSTSWVLGSHTPYSSSLL